MPDPNQPEELTNDVEKKFELALDRLLQKIIDHQKSYAHQLTGAIGERREKTFKILNEIADGMLQDENN